MAILLLLTILLTVWCSLVVGRLVFVISKIVREKKYLSTHHLGFVTTPSPFFTVISYVNVPCFIINMGNLNRDYKG